MKTKYFTCEEVAEITGFKIATVWQWVREKKLPAIKFGKVYRIAEDDLKTYIESRRTA